MPVILRCRALLVKSVDSISESPLYIMGVDRFLQRGGMQYLSVNRRARPFRFGPCGEYVDVMRPTGQLARFGHIDRSHSPRLTQVTLKRHLQQALRPAGRGARPKRLAYDRSRLSERSSWTAIVGLMGVTSKPVRLPVQRAHPISGHEIRSRRENWPTPSASCRGGANTGGRHTSAGHYRGAGPTPRRSFAHAVMPSMLPSTTFFAKPSAPEVNKTHCSTFTSPRRGQVLRA